MIADELPSADYCGAGKECAVSCCDEVNELRKLVTFLSLTPRREHVMS
jgi:hypothetical protein